MPMHYRDLIDAVRRYMVEEVEIDGENLYHSSYFTDTGKQHWKDLLVKACTHGDDVSLANQIANRGYIKTLAERRTKTGTTSVRVPHDAHETVAESNFSRFYLRGVCRYAIDHDIPYIVGYRAMEVERPREGSNEKIGQHFDPRAVLDDLRATMSGQPTLGMPPGVGSGILAYLPHR